MSSEQAANQTPQTERQPISGADILVQQLVNHGVDTIFAYPGGFTIPLHQAYTRFRDKVRVILPRHEQGGAFAAQGYARATGKVGVVSATSGPGAANLLTAIADAKLDSVPMVIITGQVVLNTIGTDAFQEMPTTEVFRSVTKHYYLVRDVKDLARIVREAIYVATTGRKGPVLIDLPKDIQTSKCVPDYDEPMQLPGYHPEPEPVDPIQIDWISDCLRSSKQPVILAGGGVIASEASAELLQLAERLQIPVTTTLMGLGAFPGHHPLSLDMIGMHGSVYANKAVNECDLLIALGCRFSDRVTGNISKFAPRAKNYIIHVDIDASELNKVVKPVQSVEGDVKKVLSALLKNLPQTIEPQTGDWLAQLVQLRQKYPFQYDYNSPYILPQAAIEELCRQTESLNPIITTGVGQHQMWSTQYFKCSTPRQFLSSGGAGTMGFGLPAAMGAKAAFPDRTVLCVEGDGSLLMNVQELATCYCEDLPVKLMVMNNQHLGMVMQWEDRFFRGNRAHTYLGPIGDPEAVGKGTNPFGPDARYPDFVHVAEGFGWQGRNISKKEELAEGIAEMLAAPGPFLLNVAIPYREHVLPMIPAGGSIADLITK